MGNAVQVLFLSKYVKLITNFSEHLLLLRKKKCGKRKKDAET